MTKKKLTITADHLTYGEVQFTIPAEDAKDVFNKWKQIVFSPRQWRVTRNSASLGDRLPDDV